MKIACTGYVSADTGSVAAANALLLNALLKRGIKIDFFSKPSFVDPRPAVGECEGFRFVPTVNQFADTLHRRLKRVPPFGTLAGRFDAASYNRLLVACIHHEHQKQSYDLCLWMGDYASGSVPGLPTISFVQGPPGTDARSILQRHQEVKRLCGEAQALKWTTLARLRLSRLGLPDFSHSEHFIVGSEQSRRTLDQLYSIDPARISVVPYPIDLRLFHPSPATTQRESGALRILWLGRIVPRKRLDLFLQGAGLAIAQGADVLLTVVGRVGFVRGYERLIKTFPFPERLEWIQGVARTETPALIQSHDVLGQPSDEENFGSSVAEAQACGLPVIVGLTNGNADYLSPRDIHLSDDQPETFAQAVTEMGRRKRTGQLGDPGISRGIAENYFHIDRIVDRLLQAFESVQSASKSQRLYQTEALENLSAPR